MIFASYPEARHHPYGALSYWLSVSGPGDSAADADPARARCPGPPTARPRSRRRPPGARRSCCERPPASAPRPARSPPPGTSPAVTVVMAAQDDGPLVRQTRGVAAGADLHRLAPRRRRPRLGRRHRAVLRAWRPSTTASPSCASRGAGSPARSTSPSSTSPPSTSPSCRSGASGCPRCSPSSSPHAHRTGAAAVLAGAGAVGPRPRSSCSAVAASTSRPRLLRRRRDQGRRRASTSASTGAVERDLLLRLTRDHEPLAVDVPVARRRTRHAAAGLRRRLGLRRPRAPARRLGRGRRPDDSTSGWSAHVLPLNAEPRRTVEWLSSVPREGVGASCSSASACVGPTMCWPPPSPSVISGRPLRLDHRAGLACRRHQRRRRAGRRQRPSCWSDPRRCRRASPSPSGSRKWWPGPTSPSRSRSSSTSTGSC